MAGRNTTIINELESTIEDTTDANTKTDIREDAFQKYSHSVTNGQMKIPHQQGNDTYLGSSANVITLEEVKRRMELEETLTETFQPEVVEDELQRLLAFFDREFKVQMSHSLTVPDISLQELHWCLIMNKSKAGYHKITLL